MKGKISDIKNIPNNKIYVLIVNHNLRKESHKEALKVKIHIHKPGITFKIIKNGSVGLAEAYMKGDFETDDLTKLIELTAKNIKLIYIMKKF